MSVYDWEDVGGDMAYYEAMLENELKNIREILEKQSTTEQSSMVGEWKWETNDICLNCGYPIPHLERIVGEKVLMDSKDWPYCPNCGSRR